MTDLRDGNNLAQCGHGTNIRYWGYSVEKRPCGWSGVLIQ